MNALSVLLAVSPVFVIFLLLAWRRMAADLAGVIGLLVTATVAWLYFHTAPTVVIRSALAGMVSSFPISLMVGASIFQMTYMIEVGAELAEIHSPKVSFGERSTSWVPENIPDLRLKKRKINSGFFV